MIPAYAITDWATVAPWATRDQIEQDLLLSRLICEIAADPYLGSELIFRGGTCFHKLRLGAARRYSEDLDYVRSTGGSIKQFTTAVTDLGTRLGYDVTTRISANPKAYLVTRSATGGKIRIKVEVNTRERSPVDPIETVPYRVNSPWWAGTANVRTFSLRELVATKIRALYERKKSRDVFDLWLALTELDLTGDDLLAAFDPYRPDSLTAKTATANLRDKLVDDDFRHDLDAFTTTLPDGYQLDTAAELIIREVLSKIPRRQTT